MLPEQLRLEVLCKSQSWSYHAEHEKQSLLQTPKYQISIKLS